MQAITAVQRDGDTGKWRFVIWAPLRFQSEAWFGSEEEARAAAIAELLKRKARRTDFRWGSRTPRPTARRPS